MRFCLVRYEFGFDDGRGWGLFISRRNICFILRRNTHKSLKAPGLSILRFSTKEGPPFSLVENLYVYAAAPTGAVESIDSLSIFSSSRQVGRALDDNLLLQDDRSLYPFTTNWWYE